MDYQSPEWKKAYLHLFLLSSAGKPIYSRYGDENELAGLIGVMQAINFFSKDLSHEVEELISKNKRVIFSQKDSLIFVTVGNVVEKRRFFTICTEYVYNQIVFLLTKRKLDSTFQISSNLDLRNLLVDNIRRFDRMLAFIEVNLGPYINSVQCLPLKKTFRDNLNQSLASIVKKSGEDSCLVFLVLFQGNKLVTYLSAKKQSLEVQEIHLIQNLLETSKTFKSVNSNWLPICLPNYDDNGFLHAHISYLTTDLTLTLISYDREKFYELDRIKTKILESFKDSSSSIINTLSNARRLRASEVEGLDTSVRMFVYIYNDTFYTSSSWTCPYGEEESSEDKRDLIERRRVMAGCRGLYDKLRGEEFKCEQAYMMVGTEAFYATKHGSEISIMIFEPFVDQVKAIEYSSKLHSWIYENRNRLFLTNQINL